MPGAAGPATDAANQPVVDPTANVLDLVAAGNQRQDDLRAMEGAHIRDLIGLRAGEAERRITATQYVDGLRDEHAKELRIAEAARIDAIRAVDVGNVQQAAEVQANAQSILANQVAAAAEAMRTQVAAAASAAAVALGAALEPIQKDIQDLRKAQYEAQGKTTAVVESGFTTRAWVALAIGAAAVISSGTLGVAGIVITLLLR
jgi:hypothetical protein